MPDAVTIRENGRAEAMYALKPAWHNLGTVLDFAPDGYTALKSSGLIWENEQWPLQAIVTRESLDDEGNIVNETVLVPIKSRVANLRSDNNGELGIVGNVYRPCQNVEAFKFVDDLVEEETIKYESAGSLKGGRTVWLLARMPKVVKVTENDELNQYILFTNSHDGSKAIRVLPTSVRVVCQNTLNLAIGRNRRSDEGCLTIPHRGDLTKKLAAAREVLGVANKQFDRFTDTARILASAPFARHLQEQLVKELIPDVPVGMNNTRRENARERMMGLMTDTPQQVDGISGTAWAAFNAVTQYVDHVAPRSGRGETSRAENRMSSVIFGSGARFKVRALNRVKTLAGINC